MSRDVFVVLRFDGLWDASCCDPRCGGGLHGVGDNDGIHETKTSADRAARAHRRELAAEPVRGAPATVCPTCGHRNVPKEAP